MGIYENIRIITLIKRFFNSWDLNPYYMILNFSGFLIVYIKEGMRKNGTCFFESDTPRPLRSA